MTKYRKPVRSGAVGVRVRDLIRIREICGVTDVLLIKGHVSKDHIHLLVSIAPQVTISRLVRRLKRKTAYKRLGGCSSGNVTDEVVAASIENQDRGQSGDFRVEEGGE